MYFILNLKKIGALTSKLYAFKARPWETSLVKSIDNSNNLASPILIETKDAKILRILPSYNKHLQIEWCSDKTRYMHESNDKHRLAHAYALNKKNYFEKLYNSANVYKLVSSLLGSFKNFDILVGANQDNDTLYKAKHIARKLGADYLSEFNSHLNQNFAFSYSSTKSLDSLEEAKSICFIGLNPRIETTVANLVFRFRFLKGNFKVYSLSCAQDLTYYNENYGSIIHTLVSISSGKHKLNTSTDKKTLIACGDSLSKRYDGQSIIYFGISAHHKSYAGILNFSNSANYVGAMHLAYNKWKSKNNTYFLGAEDEKSFKLIASKNYLCESSHVHKALKKASMLLPLPSHYEKNSSIYSYEGLIQKSYKALNFGGESIKAICNLSKSLNTYYFFAHIKKAENKKYLINYYTEQIFQKCIKKKQILKLSTRCIKSFYANMYNTSCISKASPTLTQLSNVQTKAYMSFI